MPYPFLLPVIVFVVVLTVIFIGNKMKIHRSNEHESLS